MDTETARGVQLWDLRMASCRWPLGGTWEPVEFFCGAPAVPGCSWCAEHRQRAFARAIWPPSKGAKDSSPGKNRGP